jgi:hypothetical protein
MSVRRGFRALVALAIATLVMTTVALADDISNDLDTSIDATAESTTVAVGGTVSVGLFVQPRNGDGDNGCNFEGTTQALKVSVSSSSPSTATVAPSEVTFGNCGDTPSLTVMGIASGTASITLAEVSNNTGGTFNLAPATFEVSVFSPNTAPTDPGVPTTSANPTNGSVAVTWTASTDAQSDPITYELQGHRTGEDFATIQSGIPTSSYTHDAAEGTWTYRVRASDGTLVSDFSAASAAIVVDLSAPTAPLASFDRAAEYNDGTNDWFRNTVTVSYDSSTDPVLADGSAGSGVADYTDAQTFSSTGTHAYSGTATDFATNESLATTGTVNVDATAPTVTLTCPAGPFIKGSSATLAWAASDVGSGLATAATGSLTLDTSAIGSFSAQVAAGTAADNVGLTSAASNSCAYSVIFDFNGFFRPVDNLPALNVSKAGSAIPIKFSLGGDQGLDILATGSPTSKVSTCEAAGAPDTIEETVTAGQSSLSYDADADQYVYVWKTEKAWAGTCRTLTVKLADGTVHQALFKLAK